MNQADMEKGKRLVREMIELIGDDPNREGLLDTPDRVVRSWLELFSGYEKNPTDFSRVFEQPCDQMIVLRDIQFYSFCEHHMLPFHGTCHIAYLPSNNRVLGLSKLARLVDVYARRLQIQERLTSQIAEGIQEMIEPKGVAVFMDAHHLCMMMRGVNQQTASMRTHKLLGVFLEDEKTRAEAISIMGIGRQL